jgi:thioredoxin-like negative regulator of GroEL
METLRQARDKGKLDQFAADHEADPPGDEAAFNAALQSMAGKSKAVPEASTPDAPDD